MRKITKSVITISILVLIMSMASGCGKKKDKNLSDSTVTADENIKTDEVTDSQPSEKETDIVAENISESVAEENVINLRPSIVEIDRFIEGRSEMYTVGYMSIDYVELDEESEAICPNLANSINEFNDKRKNEFDKRYPQFEKDSQKYADRFFDGSYSDDDLLWDDWVSWENHNSAQVMRADNVAMSVLSTYVDYHGEGEGQIVYTGDTYDSQTGKKLSITDVVEDWDAYEAAIASELRLKYGKVKTADIDYKKYQGWVLTPEGIIIYYSDDYVDVGEDINAFVQINKCTYPGLISEKYCVAPKEYAIPMRANDIFYMDFEGDGKDLEAVMYSPVHPEGYEDGDEYPSYAISVNGKVYDNFEEDWFYGYRPYYVHKKDGCYIYVYTQGYEHDFIAVNKIMGVQPICVAKLPGTPFDIKNVDYSNEEYIYRQIAFSDPAMLDDVLSFNKNICGTYRSEEGDDWEVRRWDICNIDGRYYLDCIGEYDYMGAEIELLDETPYSVGDELRYMVKMYPYSGFSFAGDYQGLGKVMYISVDMDCDDKCIRLSADNPFFTSEQTLWGEDGVSIHEVQDKKSPNISASGIIGSWRCNAKRDSQDYEIYMQFDQDGCVDIVRKSEGYTPMVYRGIYNLKKNGDIYTGSIEAEAIGMGTQPAADWALEFDPSSDNSIIIKDAYEDDNPLLYGVDDMKFYKTEPGKRDKFIHPGPWNRTMEVSDMWYEYIAIDDDSFMYDFQPEYVEAIEKKAMRLAEGTSYTSYGIQDDGISGEIWIKVMCDVAPSVQTTKNWVRYDLGSGDYCDIFDNRLEEE